ncbi:uncharacterized protein LOC123013873 [Tribolium madens]|uniref:uncharacterized protein LOC123013873 n=1 Tax=Tribolium madens TaxID=41895 RepID=UPI001CF735E8|nr:uncharacterized protein LOC123013873 [Tribolium madens]
MERMDSVPKVGNGSQVGLRTRKNCSSFRGSKGRKGWNGFPGTKSPDGGDNCHTQRLDEVLGNHYQSGTSLGGTHEIRGRKGGSCFTQKGPHPADQRLTWQELVDSTTEGTWIFTDASRGNNGVGVGIVKIKDGNVFNTEGLVLQEDYPTHMTELWALRVAAREQPGANGETIHFATDSRVALDMLCGRKGGTAHNIWKQMQRIQDEGATVKLWWASETFTGNRKADQIARQAREEPDRFPREQAPLTGRDAQKATMDRWQQEWDRNDKGRATHRIISVVSGRLRGWSHRAVCLLTGHGPFRGYFNRFHLREGNGECLCEIGVQDTAEHALTECTDDERETTLGERRNESEGRTHSE